MSNTLAKGFATLFDGLANDADPDGHTPVKNEFLTDCAAELRRLDGYASAVKAGGVVAAVIKDGAPQWVKNQPALSNGTLLYAIPPDHAAILREAMDALRNAVGDYVKVVKAYASAAVAINRRAALSHPSTAQTPVAWAAMNEEGEPVMLFFDKQEARHYCAEDEEPRALGYIAPPAQGGKG